jgi:AhpD family alkylhydroperoxidase
MHDTLEEFKKYREKMNEKILASGNQQIHRFFNLDTRAYEPGALPSRTKELLGLVASVVLRCDECVTYHVIRCAEEGVTSSEFYEALNVALVVGGSITIPHIRRAVERLEECGVSGRPAQSKRDQILDHAI